MKRILTFSAYYYPETAASLYLSDNLFEDMVKYGWNVILFTPTPTRSINNNVRKEYKKKRIEFKYNNKFMIIRLHLFRENRSTFIRFLRYFVMTTQFFIAGIFVPADVIFAQSTPPILGFMAGVLSKFKRIPFVYSLQDIFPDSMVHAGLCKEGSLVWRTGRFIENYTYRNADKIVVISEDYKKNLLEKKVPENRIEIIYNWVEEKHVRKINRDENMILRKYKLDFNKFYITYCGNIGYSQNFDLLIDVASALLNLEQIQFIIIGDGAFKKELKERINEKKMNNFIILPFQPYKEIAHVFSLGDISLVISKPNISKNSLPSKTWSIMSAEKPVLASFDIDSELCRIIKKANCGFCVDAGNKNELIDKIIYCYHNQDELVELGKNGRLYVTKNFSREIGSADYINTVANLFGK